MGFVGKKAGIRGGLILPAGCDILKGRKEMLNMAMPEVVVQRWNEMTEDEQQQAVNFIDFLLDKRYRREYHGQENDICAGVRQSRLHAG